MTASRGRLGFRGVLVVSQVTLSLVLLFIALLFTKSLRNLLVDDPGFQSSGVLIARLDLPACKFPPSGAVHSSASCSIASAPFPA